MRYHILLAIICFAMIYVTVLSINIPSTAIIGSSFVAAKENPIIPTTEIFVEPVQAKEILKTPNGLDLTIETITNFREEQQDIIVETSTDDKTFYFNVSISPNATWSFAKLGNFLIIPQKDAVVASTSSYYAEGDELVVVLDGNTKELFIHVGEKGAPRLVITDTDTIWSYDIRNQMIKVTANNGNVSTVIMFWTGFGNDISFIEDTRRKENLRYDMVILNEHIVQLQSDIEIEKGNVAKLREELSESNERLEKARFEKIQTEEFSGNLKLSIEKGENLITASVLLSPLQAAIGIVITLILLVLLVNTFLFKQRRKEV